MAPNEIAVGRQVGFVNLAVGGADDHAKQKRIVAAGHDSETSPGDESAQRLQREVVQVLDSKEFARGRRPRAENVRNLDQYAATGGETFLEHRQRRFRIFEVLEDMKERDQIERLSSVERLDVCADNRYMSLAFGKVGVEPVHFGAEDIGASLLRKDEEIAEPRADLEQSGTREALPCRAGEILEGLGCLLTARRNQSVA